MIKKILCSSIIFITLFYLCSDISYAYEYQDSKNKENVDDLIREIYDAKEQYEDLVGGYEETEITIHEATTIKYWWPIGSKETTKTNGVLYAKGDPESIIITSYFAGLDNFRNNPHGGLDIGVNGQAIGVINVIASRAGEVVYPTSKSQTQYEDNGYYGNQDGGGYGNYVKIKHSDGTYTIYAHLAKDSITVKVGDVVDQGQVIGKVGNSGSSTGVHLHFEMREGGDSIENRVDPLEYVDPENPRPISSGSGNSFSLNTTTLTKMEFVSKMQDYYKRSGNQGFYNNFVKNAEKIYDVSLLNDVNPELVVVTAGTEQNWTLSAVCKYTNNYWGIGISNGEGCSGGGIYSSIYEGIAAYAKTIKSYSENGSNASMITSRYNDRASAKCDSSGHGLPGTLEGMQSVYSWIGDYRYDPGNSGKGGCYYLNIIYGKDYCSTKATCKIYSSCSVASKTSACEQNDYTSWQLEKKHKLRYDIFGL